MNDYTLTIALMLALLGVIAGATYGLYLSLNPPHWATALRNNWHERRNTKRLPTLEQTIHSIEATYDPACSTLEELADDMHYWSESGPGRHSAWTQYCKALDIVEQRHPDWVRSAIGRPSFAITSSTKPR